MRVSEILLWAGVSSSDCSGRIWGLGSFHLPFKIICLGEFSCMLLSVAGGIIKCNVVLQKLILSLIYFSLSLHYRNGLQCMWSLISKSQLS